MNRYSADSCSRPRVRWRNAKDQLVRHRCDVEGVRSVTAKTAVDGFQSVAGTHFGNEQVVKGGDAAADRRRGAAAQDGATGVGIETHRHTGIVARDQIAKCIQHFDGHCRIDADPRCGVARLSRKRQVIRHRRQDAERAGRVAAETAIDGAQRVPGARLIDKQVVKRGKTVARLDRCSAAEGVVPRVGEQA